MTLVKTKFGRRAFIRNTSLAGGGLVLGFSWLNSCKPEQTEEIATLEMPEEWFEMNAFLKIGDNGVVTIMSPNPEIGQNVIGIAPEVCRHFHAAFRVLVFRPRPLLPFMRGNLHRCPSGLIFPASPPTSASIGIR